MKSHCVSFARRDTRAVTRVRARARAITHTSKRVDRYLRDARAALFCKLLCARRLWRTEMSLIRQPLIVRPDYSLGPPATRWAGGSIEAVRTTHREIANEMSSLAISSQAARANHGNTSLLHWNLGRCFKKEPSPDTPLPRVDRSNLYIGSFLKSMYSGP